MRNLLVNTPFIFVTSGCTQIIQGLLRLIVSILNIYLHNMNVSKDLIISFEVRWRKGVESGQKVA